MSSHGIIDQRGPRCYGQGPVRAWTGPHPPAILGSLRVVSLCVRQAEQPVGEDRHELVPRTEVMTGRPRRIARATTQGESSDHRDDASHLRYNSLAHLSLSSKGLG